LKKKNREELDQYVRAAGNPSKVHIVFYGSMQEAKSACAKAKAQGFKIIVNSSGDQALSARNNKCCDGG